MNYVRSTDSDKVSENNNRIFLMAAMAIHQKLNLINTFEEARLIPCLMM
jgi:hypothetical protein